MSFQSRDANSVQNLLELLRSTQDGSSTAPNVGTAPSSSTPSTVTNAQHKPNLPSQSQLDDLLRNLRSGPSTVAEHESRSALSPVAAQSPSRTRSLMDPFGPLAVAGPSTVPPSTARRPSLEQYRSDISNATRGSLENSHGAGVIEDGVGERSSRTVSGTSNGADGERSGDGVATKEWNMMPLGKALPIITGLLADQGFVTEVKKMKADQDALERRLWAKSEKVRAEHERTVQAEKDIARIARRTISPAKQSQWQTTLQLAQQDFYRQTFLPSVDSLAERHKERLKQLGVPGLGRSRIQNQNLEGEEEAIEAEKVRIRRIMDVIQAVLEE